MILAILAYLPVLRAGFIWDDDDYVTNNSTLVDLSGLGKIWFKIGATPQYYPLVHTTFWVEYHLWGLNPLGYHLVNVCLHVLSAILLWRLLLRLNVPGAWLASAIFALHPVHVESVAWITERKNVLSALFYLAAALFYLRFVDRQEGGLSSGRWSFYVGALICFIAALLAKTVTCTLPIALLLVCWWKSGRIQWRNMLALLPFFATGAMLSMVTVWMERHEVGAHGADWSMGFVERITLAGRALWFYVCKLAWPTRLSFIYPRWEIIASSWQEWILPIGFAGILAGLWLARKRYGRGPLVAVLFFAATLSPALGFIDIYPFRFSFVADHFQYLASIGLISLAAVGLNRLPRIVLAVLLGVLAVLTWLQTRVYHDIETLWRDTLSKNPSSWIAHNELGLALENRGEASQAMAHYREALRLKPDSPEVLVNVGAGQMHEGKFEAAVKSYRTALDHDPKYVPALNNLGNAFLSKGRLEEAQQCFEQSLQLSPNDPQMLNNLGVTFAKKKEFGKAIEQYKAALQVAPRQGAAFFNLGNALSAQNRFEEAIPNYEASLRLSPSFADARIAYGCALAESGRTEEAISNFVEALPRAPNNPDLHFYLGSALIQAGRRDEAIEQLREAVRLKPDYTAAKQQLRAIGVEE
ncbi:MAG TPA: tetratricopeptide repeat protein [Chthoniobacterales bacterium]|nr:tetratricopeptide repeat protein [Chthoniobacterales bacterium]